MSANSLGGDGFTTDFLDVTQKRWGWHGWHGWLEIHCHIQDIQGSYFTWLVVWNMTFITFHIYIYIGNFIIPTDELTPSFFRGVGWNHQPEIIEISFIQWPFQEPKLEVPTICKAYTSGLCKGISPQNMAKHMVLTYLHFRILFYSHW